MKELKGILPAIVTPLDKSGDFDPEAMRKIIHHQLQAGVHGFYVCGGTGEGLLPTVEERQAVLETVLDEVRNRVLVIAHVGALQTADTLSWRNTPAGPALTPLPHCRPRTSSNRTRRPLSGTKRRWQRRRAFLYSCTTCLNAPA